MNPNDSDPAASPTTALPPATPVSRLLRFLLGLLLSAMLVGPVAAATWAGRLRFGAVILGLTVLYGVLHLIVRRALPRLHPWVGAVLAVGPVVGVYLLGGTFAAGAIGYIGLSLLLQALRGDPGCEVMALPGLLSRRPTHLACIVFTPIDRIEARLRAVGRS